MIFNLSTIETRKTRAAKALEQVIGSHDVVLVFSGEPITRSGGHDQTYDFLPHPDYYWLTGSRRPKGIAAFSKADGWIEFSFLVSRDEKIWEGGREVVTGRSIAEFDSWLASKKPAKIFLMGLHQHSHLSKVNAEELMIVQEAFHQVRRVKDPAEIELVKNIAVMANAGYKKLKSYIRPGVSERQIQLEYEYEVCKSGAHKMPYGTIVGTGTNAAILHAVPTERIVKPGDLVLIDAGADVNDYCVDITRVFAADGSFSDRQKTIYHLVKSAQQKAIDLCQIGSQWKDIHLASAQVMAQGLKDLNILKVSSTDAIESGVISCFYPHGVGHMVGLRVRDVGGKPNPNPKKYAGSRLRIDMQMQEGFLMTIEPGLYFIEALLNDSETRENFKDQINWIEVEKWKDFGGVRIEDNIHFTKAGPENLTKMVEK
jgi:Xaa-Pro dipeptidase